MTITGNSELSAGTYFFQPESNRAPVVPEVQQQETPSVSARPRVDSVMLSPESQFGVVSDANTTPVFQEGELYAFVPSAPQTVPGPTRTSAPVITQPQPVQPTSGGNNLLKLLGRVGVLATVIWGGLAVWDTNNQAQSAEQVREALSQQYGGNYPYAADYIPDWANDPGLDARDRQLGLLTPEQEAARNEFRAVVNQVAETLPSEPTETDINPIALQGNVAQARRDYEQSLIALQEASDRADEARANSDRLRAQIAEQEAIWAQQALEREQAWTARLQELNSRLQALQTQELNIILARDYALAASDAVGDFTSFSRNGLTVDYAFPAGWENSEYGNGDHADQLDALYQSQLAEAQSINAAARQPGDTVRLPIRTEGQSFDGKNYPVVITIEGTLGQIQAMVASGQISDDPASNAAGVTLSDLNEAGLRNIYSEPLPTPEELGDEGRLGDRPDERFEEVEYDPHAPAPHDDRQPTIDPNAIPEVEPPPETFVTLPEVPDTVPAVIDDRPAERERAAGDPSSLTVAPQTEIDLGNAPDEISPISPTEVALNEVEENGRPGEIVASAGAGNTPDSEEEPMWYEGLSAQERIDDLDGSTMRTIPLPNDASDTNLSFYYSEGQPRLAIVMPSNSDVQLEITSDGQPLINNRDISVPASDSHPATQTFIYHLRPGQNVAYSLSDGGEVHTFTVPGGNPAAAAASNPAYDYPRPSGFVQVARVEDFEEFLEMDLAGGALPEGSRVGVQFENGALRGTVYQYSDTGETAGFYVGAQRSEATDRWYQVRDGQLYDEHNSTPVSVEQALRPPVSQSSVEATPAVEAAVDPIAEAQINNAGSGQLSPNEAFTSRVADAITSGKTLTIGRDPATSDIVFPDAGTGVSRQAHVTVTSEEISIRSGTQPHAVTVYAVPDDRAPGEAILAAREGGDRIQFDPNRSYTVTFSYFNDNGQEVQQQVRVPARPEQAQAAPALDLIQELEEAQTVIAGGGQLPPDVAFSRSIANAITNGDSVTIGRDPGGIVLPDVGERVSRSHVTVEGNRVSINPTISNDRAVVVTATPDEASANNQEQTIGSRGQQLELDPTQSYTLTFTYRNAQNETVTQTVHVPARPEQAQASPASTSVDQPQPPVRPARQPSGDPVSPQRLQQLIQVAQNARTQADFMVQLEATADQPAINVTYTIDEQGNRTLTLDHPAGQEGSHLIYYEITNPPGLFQRNRQVERAGHFRLQTHPDGNGTDGPQTSYPLRPNQEGSIRLENGETIRF